MKTGIVQPEPRNSESAVVIGAVVAHTAGPWSVDDTEGMFIVCDEREELIAELTSNVPTAEAHFLMRANAARIVACVNACEGLSIETLQAAPHGHAAEWFETWNKAQTPHGELDARALATDLAAFVDSHAEYRAQRDELAAALRASTDLMAAWLEDIQAGRAGRTWSEKAVAGLRQQVARNRDAIIPGKAS